MGLYRLIATVDSQGSVLESNETNNELTLEGLHATVMGDINGDGMVNILDAVKISLAWGSTLTSPQWNPMADLNHDGTIDILDATRIGLHWGQSS
jgi:hypothetical protein